MNKTLLFTLIFASMSNPLIAQAMDNHWNSDNAPSNFDQNYEYRLDQLPTKGGLDEKSHRGWADSYWPMVKGWIADRWQQVPKTSFKDDKSPKSASQIRAMSEGSINILSPAEKFDLARGRFDFPLADGIRKSLRRHGKDWRGLCNGWVQSSLNYDEPGPFVYTSPGSGLKIPFASGDVKGLLAYYHAQLDDSSGAQVGLRCSKKSQILDINGACSDMNAGAFHVIMANEMGIRHQGFLGDEDQGPEVWNQPFVKYTSYEDAGSRKYSGFDDHASPGTAMQVVMHADVTFVNELYHDTHGDEDMEDSDHVAPSVEPVLGTPKQVYRVDNYAYTLDIDRGGRIIGGKWISKKHPDFLWKQNYKAPGMRTDRDGNPDDWSILNELVRQATAYLRGK